MSNRIEEAKRIRDTYNRTVATIRNDRTLSEQGKRERLTAAYKQAAGKLATIKQAHSAEVEKERESLRKSVFGLSFPMSATDTDKAAAQAMYRDALDRTASLRTEADALTMIENAHLTGDTTLLRAASLAAYRNQWDRALNRYSEIAPDHARRIHALRDSDGASRDPMQRLGESMAFSLERPAEVDQNALYQPQPAG